MVKNALKIATKARFSEVNSAFVDFCSDEKLLENVKDHLEGNNKLYEANIAQPFYVQLDPYGHQIAEPMAFTTDPLEFINWLKY